MTDSVWCKSPRCRRFTKHPSGLCHAHQGVRASTKPRRNSRSSVDLSIPTGKPLIYRQSGGVWSETYRDPISSLLHRVDGPSERVYRADDSILREGWHEHGEYHRVGAPARISFYADGSVCDESYYFAGKIHRLGGPAQVEYRRDGTPVEPTYGFHGSRHRSHHGIVGELGELQAHELADEIGVSDYAPLLDEGRSPEEILEVLRQGVESVESVREVFAGAPVEWVRAYEGERP